MYHEHSNFLSILRGTNPKTNERCWVARLRVLSVACPESNDEITEIVNNPEKHRITIEETLFMGSKSDILEASLLWLGNNNPGIAPSFPNLQAKASDGDFCVCGHTRVSHQGNNGCLAVTTSDMICTCAQFSRDLPF